MIKDIAEHSINHSGTQTEVGLTTSLKQLEDLSPRLFEEIKEDATYEKMFKGDGQLALTGYSEVILPTIKRLGNVEFSHLVASLPPYDSFRKFVLDRCNRETKDRIIICTNFYPPEAIIPKDLKQKSEMEFRVFNLVELLINCANKTYQGDDLVGHEEAKGKRMDLLIQLSHGINTLKFKNPETYKKAFQLGEHLKDFVIHSLIDGSPDRSPQRLQEIINDRCQRV